MLSSLKKMFSRILNNRVFLLTLCNFFLQAMCPEKCTCDDVNLIVTCIKAGLEVMPNTLNPRLRTITYKYNNFPTVDVSLRYVKFLPINIIFHKKLLSVSVFTNIDSKVSCTGHFSSKSWMLTLKPS